MNEEAEWQTMARSGAIAATIRLLSKEPGQNWATAYAAVYQWLDANCPAMLPDVECLRICERVEGLLRSYAEQRSTTLYYLLHVLSPRETVETMLAHTVVMVSRGGDPWVDLAIEVATSDARKPMFKAAIHEHLKTGVRMVWVIDAEDVSIRVATQPSRWDVFHDDYVFDGGDVLPGFSCKVADLFT